MASAGVPARCGGPWARLGAWAPSLVCGGFTWRTTPSPIGEGGRRLVFCLFYAGEGDLSQHALAKAARMTSCQGGI